MLWTANRCTHVDFMVHLPCASRYVYRITAEASARDEGEALESGATLIQRKKSTVGGEPRYEASKLNTLERDLGSRVELMALFII